MKKKRTHSEWQTYIEEQAASGLTIRQFCKEKGSCPSHFSEQKKTLSRLKKDNGASPAFVRVQSKEQRPITRSSSSAVVLCIQHSEISLRFEELPRVEWLSQFMRAIA